MDSWPEHRDASVDLCVAALRKSGFPKDDKCQCAKPYTTQTACMRRLCMQQLAEGANPVSTWDPEELKKNKMLEEFGGAKCVEGLKAGAEAMRKYSCSPQPYNKPPTGGLQFYRTKCCADNDTCVWGPFASEKKCQKEGLWNRCEKWDYGTYQALKRNDE